MAIANGTCVSFCNQPKARFGLPWVYLTTSFTTITLNQTQQNNNTGHTQHQTIDRKTQQTKLPPNASTGLRVSLGTPLRASSLAWHVRRIFGTGEARNLKLGTRIEPAGKSHLMNDKIHQTGCGQGPNGRILKF